MAHSRRDQDAKATKEPRTAPSDIACRIARAESEAFKSGKSWADLSELVDGHSRSVQVAKAIACRNVGDDARVDRVRKVAVDRAYGQLRRDQDSNVADVIRSSSSATACRTKHSTST